MFSSTEAIVGKIWAESLCLNRIDPNDNYFEMGGDSLTILTMLFQVGDALDVELRPEVLMDAPDME